MVPELVTHALRHGGDLVVALAASPGERLAVEGEDAHGAQATWIVTSVHSAGPLVSVPARCGSDLCLAP